MFFGTIKPAYGRVAQLVDQGLLEKHPLHETASAPSKSKKFFTVSKSGASLLASHFGYTLEDFNFAGKAVKKSESLKPILDVNTIRASLYRACFDHPELELLEWRNESVFRASPIQVYVPINRREAEQKPLYPDGFCRVQTPHGVAHFFIESDGGTEGYKQFVDQIKIYQAYIDSGLHTELFSSTSLRILIVTNGEKRLNSLRKHTRTVTQSSRYWFSTIGQSREPKQIASQAIWRQLTSDTSRELIEGLTELA